MKTFTAEQFEQQYGKEAVSSFNQVNSARFNKESSPSTGRPMANRISDAVGLGGATNVFGRVIARSPIGNLLQTQGQRDAAELDSQVTGEPVQTQREINRAQIEAPTKGQFAGAVAQTAALPIGAAVTGGASVAGRVAAGAGAGFLYDVGQDLVDKKSATEVATPGLGTVIGAAAPLAIAGGGALVGALRKPAQAGVTATADALKSAVPKSETISGVAQTGKELAERVPRFIGKVSENVQEAGVRAERIRTSSPVVQTAIKSGLPDPLIDPIKNANPVTKQAFKEVLDIADAPKTTLGQKQNPAVVGGNRASQQYDVIEAQRKKIGEAMNVETAKLGRIEDINMTGAYSQLDSVLEDIGISKNVTNTGVKLDFSKSKLTEKQRTVVTDLYKKATEGGDSLSPLQIREKDQLFSAIQRESRSDAVQDVIFTTADGQTTDLFRAFRDVYSNELDVLSPEIKRLNSQYRNVATLLEDIENSIFKTPNFEITKNTDPSEFAKVNLRRIFGEAQSSPAYEAIADEMDTISRQLGYEGASPKEVAAFAEEIRALYPENTPRAGFQGGIRAGVVDIASSIMELGKADQTDQRAALRALLEATSESAQ